MKHVVALFFFSFNVLSFGQGHAPPLSVKYVDVEPPPGYTFKLRAIDNTGQMIGTVVNSEGTHGLTVSGIKGGGNMQVDDCHPDVCPNAVATQFFGASLQGPHFIVGKYTDSASTDHGVVFDHDHSVFLSSFDPPNSIATVANGVNDAETIVGTFQDSGGLIHGFIFSNGSFTVLDAPGAIATSAVGINDQGLITIEAKDRNGNEHALLYNQGSYSRIDCPSTACPNVVTTTVEQINNTGDILVQFVDTAGNTHGQVIHNGAYSFQINDPEGDGKATQPFGINDARSVVGAYSGGQYTSFKVFVSN